MADGLSDHEIAEQLYLSVGSVKAHIFSALAKLDLDNRVQLAIVAHESHTPLEQTNSTFGAAGINLTGQA